MQSYLNELHIIIFLTLQESSKASHKICDTNKLLLKITPGGKAAQANVMQGDVLIAINGFTVSHLDLTELMETIKLSGWTLHLTLIRFMQSCKWADYVWSEPGLSPKLI